MTEFYVGLAGVSAAIAGILAATLFFTVEVSTSQFTHRATRAVIGQRILWLFAFISALSFLASLLGAIRAAFPSQDFVGFVDLNLNPILTDGWWAVGCVALATTSGILFAWALIRLSRLLDPVELAMWFAETGQPRELADYALFTHGVDDPPPATLLAIQRTTDGEAAERAGDADADRESLQRLRDEEIARLHEKSLDGRASNPIAPTFEMMSRSVATHDVETFKALASIIERQLTSWIKAGPFRVPIDGRWTPRDGEAAHSIRVVLESFEAVIEAARESGHPRAGTSLLMTVRRLGEALSTHTAYLGAAAQVPEFLFRHAQRALVEGDEYGAREAIEQLGTLGVASIESRQQVQFDQVCHWLRGAGRAIARTEDERLYNDVDSDEFDTRPLDTLVFEISKMTEAVNRALLKDNVAKNPFLPPDLIWAAIDICRALIEVDGRASRFQYPMNEMLGVSKPVSEAAVQTGNAHLLNQGLSGILECLGLIPLDVRPTGMNRIAADTFVACGFWAADRNRSIDKHLGASSLLDLVIQKTNDSDLPNQIIIEALDGMLGRGEWMRVADASQQTFVIELEKARGGADLHSTLTRWVIVEASARIPPSVQGELAQDSEENGSGA